VKQMLMFAAAIAALLCCPVVPAMAQDAYSDSQGVAVTATVVRVYEHGSRLAVRTDAGRRYNIDASNADVATPGADAAGNPGNISPGDRVIVAGQLYGIGLVEANHVTVVSPTPAVEPVDAIPAPAPAVLETNQSLSLDGTVNGIASDRDVVFVTSDDNREFRVRAGHADIILADPDRSGTINDLEAGTRVRVIAENIDGPVIVADRIRVLAQLVVAPAPPPVLDLSAYTGILIDVRAFPNIQRSPSPAIYGPDMSLVYPDRAHVPSPDEVQDESIVRYYRTTDSAVAGVGGSNPLIIPADAVVGPAEDSVVLSADNATLFNKLNDRLHYLDNWKVGFLVPADR
jgi:hypothetical protein